MEPKSEPTSKLAPAGAFRRAGFGLPTDRGASEGLVDFEESSVDGSCFVPHQTECVPWVSAGTQFYELPDLHRANAWPIDQSE